MSEVRFGENDRSLGELFGDLAREMSTLVRQELDLAKTEMTQKATHAGKNAALVLVLARAMPAWGAALLVGVVVAAAGGAMAYAGLNALKQEDLAPRETI